MSVWDHIGEWLIRILLGALALLLIGLPFIFVADCKNQNRLMGQCLADGHKEYECVSLLRREYHGTNTVVIPVHR